MERWLHNMLKLLESIFVLFLVFLSRYASIYLVQICSMYEYKCTYMYVCMHLVRNKSIVKFSSTENICFKSVSLVFVSENIYVHINLILVQCTMYMKHIIFLFFQMTGRLDRRCSEKRNFKNLICWSVYYVPF